MCSTLAVELGEAEGLFLFFVAVAPKASWNYLPPFPPPQPPFLLHPRTNTGRGSLPWCLTRYHLCGFGTWLPSYNHGLRTYPGPTLLDEGSGRICVRMISSALAIRKLHGFHPFRIQGLRQQKLQERASKRPLLLCRVACCAIAALVLSSLVLRRGVLEFCFLSRPLLERPGEILVLGCFFLGGGPFGVLFGWTSYLMPSCGGDSVFVGVSRSSIQRWRKRRGLTERQIDCGQSFCDLENSANRK